QLAGLSHDYADAPRAWLAPPEEAAQPGEPAARRRPAPPPPEPEQPPALLAGEGAGWPQDLAAFHSWWLAEPALDEGRLAGRVPPRGAHGAQLMVIIAQPEAEDGETLLSGPEGRLLAAMLAAMGMAPDATYVASVLPRFTPAPDWRAAATAGLGAVLARHVDLVGPARVLLLGEDILPLLAHDPTQNTAVFTGLNQKPITVPLLAGRSLGFMLGRPMAKAHLWRRWLEWDGPE
ncbi:MAG TPA: uracil-DNA glycosylase family protein, partial [Novosphingobium sp.]|nr:uracil-DNA glycosylase family protein [Novosphingobium sp.]